MNLVVLISGAGSNLQAVIDACKSGKIHGRVAVVISNKADAYGLTRASAADIPTAVISNQDYADRIQYDVALMTEIDRHQPDLIVMAGFMRILTPAFVNHYAGRMLNIHPSLLPKYQGLHTHQKAIDASDSEHGASVHFVTEELDGGPVILQAKVPIFAEDTAAELAQRVHVQEHQIYPLVINWFCQQRLVMKEGKAWLDGECLPVSGYASDDDSPGQTE
jgi:phosphoribosylglycinamide formyltransferase 1